MVIITADHTRIAAHMQAIKYLTLNFHSCFSFCLVCSQHGTNLAGPLFVSRAEASPEGFSLFSFRFVILGGRLYNLGFAPLTLIYS